MDEINQLVSPETQALILQILTVLTLVLPLLEKLAEKTANKVDDKVISVAKTVLGLVPRVRLGSTKESAK